LVPETGELRIENRWALAGILALSAPKRNRPRWRGRFGVCVSGRGLWDVRYPWSFLRIAVGKAGSVFMSAAWCGTACASSRTRQRANASPAGTRQSSGLPRRCRMRMRRSGAVAPRASAPRRHARGSRGKQS
jgi:hypothetical protein